MKDTIIKAQQKKQEIILFLSIFIFAFILNIISILIYHTRWIEIITQLHIVLLISAFIYAVIWLIRLLIKAVKKIIAQSKQA